MPLMEKYISTYEAWSKKAKHESVQVSISNCWIVEIERTEDMLNYMAGDAISKIHAMKSSIQQTTWFFSE